MLSHFIMDQSYKILNEIYIFTYNTLTKTMLELVINCP